MNCFSQLALPRIAIKGIGRSLNCHVKAAFLGL
jgi:hypothetical protein